jgi:hypothetical protein
LISNPSLLKVETSKKCKNHFTALVRKTKKKKYSGKFTQASNNIKTTWNLINHLLNRSYSQSTAPMEMNDKKGILSNPNDIGNGFNDFLLILALN